MILRLDGVSVDFGGRRVLDSISLELEAGSQHALTGRSGSGKTTCLLVLAGLLAPTAGAVLSAIALREIVYVPQAPSLVDELTAEQNASLGLRVRGVDPAEALDRAREQLEVLGLAGTGEAFPAELSGGMQQRVALARALAVRPKVLLVDEPTGALDRATGEQVIEVLRRQASETVATVVVATHDASLAETFPMQLRVDGEHR